jgi:hypothetical protein
MHCRRVLRPFFILVVLALSSCKPAPVAPPSPANATCALLAAQAGWSEGLAAASQRSGVPASFLLAVIRQESNFTSDRRSPRTEGPYGYAQADARTWTAYQDAAARPNADRNNFTAAVEFVGWYLRATHDRSGLAYERVAEHYLVYSRGEGASGPASPAARRNAARVTAFANLYEKDLAACPPR